MTATIQANVTSAKKLSYKALVIMLIVILAHISVLTLLANMKPMSIRMPEPPKPVEVRFVELTKPKPPEPVPTPPKPQPKPKEVKVVAEQPKPKPLPKPKPILTTPTPSAQPQAVVAATPEPEPKPEPPKPVEVPKPAPPPAPPAKVAPTPQPPAAQMIDGVSYIRPPRLQISDNDLKGQSRTVKLRISISATGKVEDIQVVSSSGLTPLDEKVARALRKAIFTPHRVDGVAVPVYTIQPFELNLSQ